LTATDLPRAFEEIASTTRQEITLTIVMSSALSPKLYMDSNITGIRDAATVHMISAVDLPIRM